MTDTPSIPPALTSAIPPEEWTAQLARTPEERRKHLLWARDEVDAFGYLTIHGLAALALYGQPFGFTQEDVARLERAASVLEWYDAEHPPLSDTEHDPDGLRSLRARIAALLPPK
jgi:hypothetical protein